MPSFNVVVVGAGIAGLTTALALTHKGHKVTILEKYVENNAVGGPIHLAPNATRVLFKYGLKEVLEQNMILDTSGFSFRRYDTGKQISFRPAGVSSSNVGFPLWGFSRYALVKTLSKVAEERGVKIIYGCQITDIDETRPAVHFEDGSSIEADLIVGADRIRSIIRDVILKDKSPKRIKPLILYNIDLPLDQINLDPELAKLFQTSNMWWGPQQLVVATKEPNRNVVNVSFDKISEGEDEGDWYSSGEKVRATFAHFDPRVDKLLKLGENDLKKSYIWKVSALPPLPTWVNENGRVVLAGDSAHAMLPHASSGGAASIEDAACLAECLDRATSTSDMHRVLKAYETIRKPRVEWISAIATFNCHSWHMPDGPDQQQRDERVGARPLGLTNEGWDGKHVDDPPSSLFGPLTFPYLDGHNVFDYTARRLNQILA